MFNSLLDLFLEAFKYFALFIIDNVMDPIWSTITRFIPDLSSYLQDVSFYLTNYLFHGAKFARDVFLNITGFPIGLFQALMVLLLARFGIMIYLLLFKFVFNALSLWKTGKSAYNTLGGKN